MRSPSTAALAVLALALAALPAALAAQEDEHVVEARSVVSRSAVRPGETFKAAVVLRIRPGFHINDPAPLDEFMIPTALTVASGQGFEALEVAFPPSRRARFSYAEGELAVYDGEIVVGILLRAGEKLAPGPVTVKAALSYQACDEETCLPPMDLAVDIAVTVSSDGGAETHAEIFDKLRFKSPEK